MRPPWSTKGFSYEIAGSRFFCTRRRIRDRCISKNVAGTKRRAPACSRAIVAKAPSRSSACPTCTICTVTANARAASFNTSIEERARSFKAGFFVTENRDSRCRAWNGLAQELQTFCVDLHRREAADAREVSAGPRNASDEPTRHRIADLGEHDGNRPRRLLGSQRGDGRARDDDVDAEPYQLGRQRRGSVLLTQHETGLDGNRPVLHISELLQPLSECADAAKR